MKFSVSLLPAWKKIFWGSGNPNFDLHHCLLLISTTGHDLLGSSWSAALLSSKSSRTTKQPQQLEHCSGSRSPPQSDPQHSSPSPTATALPSATWREIMAHTQHSSPSTCQRHMCCLLSNSWVERYKNCFWTISDLFSVGNAAVSVLVWQEQLLLLLGRAGVSHPSQNTATRPGTAREVYGMARPCQHLELLPPYKQQ